MIDNVKNAFWFETWAGNSAKGWLVVRAVDNSRPPYPGADPPDPNNPLGIKLKVYELDELDGHGWLTEVGEHLYLLQWLKNIPKEEYFSLFMWKEEDSKESKSFDEDAFYLSIEISYKTILPRFGHSRTTATDHDYQWWDQDEIIHHSQLLQYLLLYASKQGAIMNQLDTCLLHINQPIEKRTP